MIDEQEVACESCGKDFWAMGRWYGDGYFEARTFEPDESKHGVVCEHCEELLDGPRARVTLLVAAHDLSVEFLEEASLLGEDDPDIMVLEVTVEENI
jgi:DNA-directed RNA polymerase subunit RPC12/RpoP